MFVTADKGAAQAASSHPDVVHVRPLAFVAGVVASIQITDLWTAVCDERRWIHDDAWDMDCVAALACSEPAEAAGKRSPVSAKIRTANELLSWAETDFKALIGAI